MKVICDKCKKSFEVKVKTREKDNLIQVYFTCSHCEKEYHSYYENEQSLELQKKINDKNKELLKSTTPIKKVETMKELKTLRLRKRKILEGINKKIPRTIEK